jgi:hypothetical protein
LKAASSDSLKKAASLLGLALDLYQSDNGRQSSNNGAFTSPQAAIEWGIQQGAFKIRQHAANAYTKLKREKNPETATKMGRLWRADIQRRLAEVS